MSKNLAESSDPPPKNLDSTRTVNKFINRHRHMSVLAEKDKQKNAPDLQDKYDIAASAAPRCIAVQHIAAFWKEISRREPDAANTS